MNCIVFKKENWGKSINFNSNIYSHLTKVLKVKTGDDIRICLVDFGVGKAKILQINENNILLDYPKIEDLKKNQELLNVTLLIGVPRIPVLKRLLKDLSAIGIKKLIFYSSNLSEKSYFLSSIWQEYEKYQLEGLSQGEVYLMPKVEKLTNINNYDFSKTNNLILHIGKYKNLIEYFYQDKIDKEILLAIGPERGWDKKELDFFKSNNFKFLSLGHSKLRVESACISSAVICSLLSKKFN